MRFLQLEWHSHERARNAWDIERAEMKSKIVKQEGECRQNKRLNEQLSRQVRMLEMALKSERAKNKSGAGRPATPEIEKEAKSRKDGDGDLKSGKDELMFCGCGRRLIGRAASMNHNTSTHDAEDALGLDQAEREREQYIDSTTKYLKNCMKEIQYLLQPPQQLPPPQALPNGNYTGLPDPPLMVDDMYVRNQQRNVRQQSQALPHPSAVPNHQLRASPSSLPHPSGPGVDHGRLAQYSDYSGPSQSLPENSQQTVQHTPPPYEEQVENVTHTFDSRGRPVPNPDTQQDPRQIRQQPDADGWTFDDEPLAQQDNPPPDLPPPRRPDTDLFPNAASNSNLAAKSPPRSGPGSHRRKSSGSQAMSRRRSSQGKTESQDAADAAAVVDPSQFKVKFALRGHLDVVRSVIFSGGGSPSEPEVCTAGDDGTIKRWIIPASYQNFNLANNTPDLDIAAYFTHRGHQGVVTSLATCPASTGFSTGGRSAGDGWIFSGGQDATIRVWERGRVDPKATLEGHTDAVWAVCVLPTSVGVVFGAQSQTYGGPDRLLLVSGSADGTVKVWSVSSPPQVASPSTGSRRGVGGSRRHSVTSGSNFPSSPQPSVQSNVPFTYTLIHSIERPATGDGKATPTSICTLSPTGETFVVSYTDSSVLIFDTRTAEELIGMASNETYDGTMDTSINTVVATSLGLEGNGTNTLDSAHGREDEVGAGATGNREGLEGVVISGHEDRFVRFFDANSGKSLLCFSFTSMSRAPPLTAPKANAHTPCSHTLLRSRLWLYRRMAVKLYQPATMPVYASGRWRNDIVRRTSSRTGR